jgi:chromosome segregation ATPase
VRQGAGPVSRRTKGGGDAAGHVWPWQVRRRLGYLQEKLTECEDERTLQDQALAALNAKVAQLEHDLEDAREVESGLRLEINQLAAARLETEHYASRLRRAVDDQKAALAELEHAAVKGIAAASRRGG